MRSKLMLNSIVSRVTYIELAFTRCRTIIMVNVTDQTFDNEIKDTCVLGHIDRCSEVRVHKCLLHES